MRSLRQQSWKQCPASLTPFRNQQGRKQIARPWLSVTIIAVTFSFVTAIMVVSRKLAGCRVDASLPRVLSSTLPPPKPLPINAPPPLVHWCISSRLPLFAGWLSCRLLSCRAASPFVAQPPSSFALAGCCVAWIAPITRITNLRLLLHTNTTEIWVCSNICLWIFLFPP